MKLKPTSFVIGSGMGGIAVAIRLAVKGHDVTVFERSSFPGGKLGLLESKGYRFDTGPSLFTQPQNIEEIFQIANEPLEDFFQYESVPIANKYFFENGKVINAYTDAKKLSQELKDVVDENPEAIVHFLRESEKMYQDIGVIFLEHSLHLSGTWLHRRIIPAIKSTRLRYLLKSMNEHHVQSFKSKETVQIFNRFATYNGSNPYKAPSMLSMIPHLEQNQGTFYPKGGMISIPDALYRLALKKGVRFEFNSEVTEILHANGVVKGISVNGINHFSDNVISNADVYYVYKNLLKNEKAASKVLKQERSSSAMIFYWGIKSAFPELHLHNIFFTSNYQEEFKCLFEKGTLYHDPTIYINITSKMEKGHAPDGKENWFVMINAPADKGHTWEALQKEARSNILQKLSRILGRDISGEIETEFVLHPRGIQDQTLSHMGSLYGTSSNSIWAAFLRHPNFKSSIKGLYFTGGSVHPGGGIPLCLKSAKIVADMV
ncbi:MAG: 1-hydroxycarotenoid 3,4-desaturase CrtD [Chitinophagaceae bacterium]